jgi:hypothetical protein
MAHDLPCFFIWCSCFVAPTPNHRLWNQYNTIQDNQEWLTTRNWKIVKTYDELNLITFGSSGWINQHWSSWYTFIYLLCMRVCVCPPSLSLSSRRCFLGWATHVQSCCWRRSVHAKVGGDLSENCRVCVARSPTFPQSLFTWSGMYVS